MVKTRFTHSNFYLELMLRVLTAGRRAWRAFRAEHFGQAFRVANAANSIVSRPLQKRVFTKDELTEEEFTCP